VKDGNWQELKDDSTTNQHKPRTEEISHPMVEANEGISVKFNIKYVIFYAKVHKGHGVHGAPAKQYFPKYII